MKNKNLIDSFNNAISGVIHAIRTERNMKFHVVAAVAVLIASLFMKLTRVEFIIVCFAISLVFICEMINTAIEALVDIIIDIYHPKAKIIKDVAAGAVLISTLFALIVAYFIFFDKVGSELETGLVRIQQTPIHITAVALVVTVVIVLILKAFSKITTPLSGGIPSGHAAISFSITTALALWTQNAAITILSLIISLMLIQSRLEGKIHNMLELVTGAVLGFLITLLLFQVFYCNV